MNNTKWQELRNSNEVARCVWGYRCRTFQDGPGDDTLSVPWSEFMPMFFSIEWLELETRSEPGILNCLVRALRAIGVRFTLEGPNVRIWGYSRPGQTPEFA
jgi:hypothetical protein